MTSIQASEIIISLDQIHLMLGAIKALLITIAGIQLTHTLYDIFKKGD